ncbi:MAG: hypothetical protein U5R06_08695 [candidate division KSB1 bacterium]|nr:hypothetical protein [candidate division KSB1 bacterium]
MRLKDRLHKEFPDEKFLLHPELCEETGENMVNEVKGDDVFYITPACGVEKQRQEIPSTFEHGGVYLTKDNWNPVSLIGLSTEAAFQIIKDAMLEKADSDD